MAGLDSNVLFYLTGESFTDSSYNKVSITPTGMTEAQIEDDMIGDTAIKCINFNTSGCLKFNLDANFLKSPFTIDWWEYDSSATSSKSSLSSLFTNITASSGGSSFGFPSSGSTKTRHTANFSSNGSSYFSQDFIAGDTILDRWVHRALVYDGSRYVCYQDGEEYAVLNNASSCYVRNGFQIGRWRSSAYALNKKVFSFRVSSTIRYNGNFQPVPEIYNDLIEGGVNIEELNENATLNEINEKIIEIREGYDTLRALLIQALVKNNVEVDLNATFQELILLVKDLLSKEEEGSIFDSEPSNPFGSELYSKIRYRDKDGKDRVIYSKYVSNDYPCFNPSTNILYFSTKATYVQGYVYENDKWNTITEAYYGYLPAGVELDSVYYTSTNIGYHSTSSNYGKVWKAKS